MKTQLVQNDRKIAGIAILTNNAEAASTIPALWEKFYGESTAGKIPGAVSDSVYAIYTNFENEGKNNEGQYTFLIGMEIEAEGDMPTGMNTIEIPSSRYHIFDVEAGKPEKVIDTWMDIWSNNNLNNSYKCDFEEYKASGKIAIYIGTGQ